MRSALYPVVVAHRRFSPKEHAFAHRVFLTATDLDEWPELHRKLRLLSVDRANAYSLRDADYLPTGEPVFQARRRAALSHAPGARLKERVFAVAASEGFEVPPGARVTLVAMPRTFGHLFNPVSFYFITDADGRTVAALAEVTNTFREIKTWFLGPGCMEGDPSGERVFRLRTPKDFYVSPFSPPDGEFEFVLRLPGERLSLRVDHHEGGLRTLTAPMTGTRRELTDGRLLLETLICPAVTLKTVALIHAHAAILWLKRVRWWPKAAMRDRQTDLRRPSR